ncbi:MAG: arsenate reductase ArsC [Deltaproteobacteria bacterium]|nr:arsenate reductase ArsC [Deltaproteobacteria bacterium]
MKKVLFLCLGNSCRSQMAEAFAKLYGEGIIEAYSAGARPAGYVHDHTIAVMNEIGVDIKDQISKRIDWNFLEQMDWVITMAGEAKAIVSSLPSRIHCVHWDVDDPVFVFGKEKRVLQAFRLTRDHIKKKVLALIEDIKQHG